MRHGRHAWLHGRMAAWPYGRMAGVVILTNNTVKLSYNGKKYLLEFLKTWLTMVLVMLFIHCINFKRQGSHSSTKLFDCKPNIL